MSDATRHYGNWNKEAQITATCLVGDHAEAFKHTHKEKEAKKKTPIKDAQKRAAHEEAAKTAEIKHKRQMVKTKKAAARQEKKDKAEKAEKKEIKDKAYKRNAEARKKAKEEKERIEKADAKEKEYKKEKDDKERARKVAQKAAKAKVEKYRRERKLAADKRRDASKKMPAKPVKFKPIFKARGVCNNMKTFEFKISLNLMDIPKLVANLVKQIFRKVVESITKVINGVKTKLKKNIQESLGIKTEMDASLALVQEERYEYV